MPGECFHKDLQTTAQTTYQMESASKLDVVACPNASIFGLLAGKDRAPLVRWDAFLVVDFRHDVEDGIRSLIAGGAAMSPASERRSPSGSW